MLAELPEEPGSGPITWTGQDGGYRFFALEYRTYRIRPIDPPYGPHGNPYLPPFHETTITGPDPAGPYDFQEEGGGGW